MLESLSLLFVFINEAQRGRGPLSKKKKKEIEVLITCPYIILGFLSKSKKNAKAKFSFDNPAVN